MIEDMFTSRVVKEVSLMGSCMIFMLVFEILSIPTLKKDTPFVVINEGDQPVYYATDFYEIYQCKEETRGDRVFVFDGDWMAFCDGKIWNKMHTPENRAIMEQEIKTARAVEKYNWYARRGIHIEKPETETKEMRDYKNLFDLVGHRIAQLDSRLRQQRIRDFWYTGVSASIIPKEQTKELLLVCNTKEECEEQKQLYIQQKI